MKIGETAPDFEAETTEGRIRFHDWIGNSWAILFSHPKDFTPVCTTELGYMAKIKPEFDRRNVKIMGLSVDSTGDHKGWAKDIEETQGQAPNYPIVGDADFKISKLYGMLPVDVEGDPKKPNFTTVLNVLEAMGLQLHVTVRREAGARAARLKPFANRQEPER